jgi:hypothetical protein
LPASEESFLLGVEEPSITLHEALRNETLVCSSLAYQVLVAHTFHECLQHIFVGPSHAEDNSDESMFWKRHHALDNRLAAMFVALPDKLRCPEHIDNHAAVFVNLELHTANICLHRAQAAEMRKRSLSKDLPSSPPERLLASAQEIFAIVAIIHDLEALFLNPLVAFATFMTAFVYLDDLSNFHNPKSEERLLALMDLMVVMAIRNPMTASLAVQLAKELHKSGIDKSAIEKVRMAPTHSASQYSNDSVFILGQKYQPGSRPR